MTNRPDVLAPDPPAWRAGLYWLAIVAGALCLALLAWVFLKMGARN